MADVESSKSIEPENEKIILRRHPRNFDPTETPTLTDNIMMSTKPRDISASKSSELPTMVAFDAYRDKPFHDDKKYITFDGMKVNVGGAFNPDTGMVSLFLISS